MRWEHCHMPFTCPKFKLLSFGTLKFSHEDTHASFNSTKDPFYPKNKK